MQVVMLCGLGGLLSWLLWSSMQVGSHLKAIRERGEPATPTELNAFYRVPANRVDSSEVWNAAIREIDLRKPHQCYADHRECWLGPPAEIDYEWTELGTAREFLAGMQLELEGIRRAASTGTHAAFEVDLSQSACVDELVDKLRWMSRVLHLDAWVAVVSGDNARALADIKAQIAIADALQYQPDLMVQLSRFGIMAIGRDTRQCLLSHMQLSDRDLADLQDRLMAPDIRADLRRGLIGDRARVLTQLNEVWQLSIAGPVKLTILSYYEESIASLEHDWPQVLREYARIEAEIDRRRSIGALFVAGPMTACQSAARADALRRCEFLTLAVRRQKLASGETPTSIDQIRDQFLTGDPKQRVLVDPFDGRELRFRVEQDKFTIYSVGRDRKDNGGALDTEFRYGVGHDCGVTVTY